MASALAFDNSSETVFESLEDIFADDELSSVGQEEPAEQPQPVFYGCTLPDHIVDFLKRPFGSVRKLERRKSARDLRGRKKRGCDRGITSPGKDQEAC